MLVSVRRYVASLDTARIVRLVALAIAVLVVVCLGLVIVLKLAPEQLARTRGLEADQRAEDVGRVRTALLALLAGVIALVGAVYTARGYRLSQRGQITDRYIRAVDQLGHERIDVRIGGVYALARIAHESETEHAEVMEVLAAFARERSPWPAKDYASPGQIGLTIPPEAPADAQAVLRAVEKRNRSFDDPSREIDLSRTNFSYTKLSADADLRGVTFAHAALYHSRLRRADLRDTDLAGVDLSWADLTSAKLSMADLCGAKLHGAILHEADLRGALLPGTDLILAQLFGAALEGAHFAAWFGDTRRGVESWVPADFGRLERALEGAMLEGAFYDETTRWPQQPEGEFNPEAWGLERR